MDNIRMTIKITLLSWISLAALFLMAGASIAAQTSAPVTTSFSGLVYDRATQTYNSVLTLTNTGASSLGSPLTIVISTGNASVTVSGSSNGSTYIWAVPGGSVAAGKSVTTTIAFSDPTRVSFTPTVVSVTGALAPDVVPNVIGATQAAATTTITSAGLTLGTITTQSSTTVAAGLVIGENPVAGTSVPAKSAVNLVVSSGAARIVVPNVVGATQAAATAAITGAGLTLGTVTTQSSTTVTAGLVISESPVAGTSVAAKSAVNLVVSSGAASVVVPNVVGATQAAATAAITSAGLTLGTVTTQSSTTVTAGLVISESPAAGTGVLAGSAVNLTISAGLPVNLTAMTTTTSLASDVSAVAAKSITQVVSTADAQSIGSPLIIPTNSDGFSTAIFALDANQNLILAAYANSGSTALSATSTATVLTMFTIGIIPSTGPSFARVVQDVQSTAGFAPLVAAITASLATGTPPLQSSAVTQATALVVNQSLPLIAAQTTSPAGALSNIRAASVIPPTKVTTMLPFQIFGPSATFPTVQSLYVTSATSDDGVYLANTMPISWSASSTDQNGAALDSGEILGPVNPIYALFITPTNVAIAGNGQEFAVLAAQTAATHEANVRQSIADVLGFLIGQLGLAPSNLSTCTQSAANNLLASLGTAFETSLINTPTGGVAAAELGGSVVGSSFYNGLRDVMQCALPGSLSQSNVAKLLANLAGWSNPATGIWKWVSLTVSAAGPANETALMVYYWNASKPIGICEDGGSHIVNCAASFEIPSPGPLQVGASTLLVPQAFDAQGRVTPYGSYTNLFWSSTNEAVATVAGGGVVTAVAQGTSTITATDLYTGATGSVTVAVLGSVYSPCEMWRGDYGIGILGYSGGSPLGDYFYLNLGSILQGSYTMDAYGLVTSMTVTTNGIPYNIYDPPIGDQTINMTQSIAYNAQGLGITYNWQVTAASTPPLSLTVNSTAQYSPATNGKYTAILSVTSTTQEGGETSTSTDMSTVTIDPHNSSDNCSLAPQGDAQAGQYQYVPASGQWQYVAP